MGFRLPNLRHEEEVALRLRALFEEKEYRLYRMGSFEEYDLYMQNKPFIQGNDVISFTGADGRLMALKPDVTLSIVKNTPPGDVRRVYYTENVFRRSRQTGEYKEISQMGLEFIGGQGAKAEAEVLHLAADCLATVGEGALDLSHMGLIEAMLAPLKGSESYGAAIEALRDKSPHKMKTIGEEAGLSQELTEKMVSLTSIFGPFEKAMAEVRVLAQGIEGAEKPLDELDALYASLEQVGVTADLRLDFSILNDAGYYNGLIFQGFIKGIHTSVLAGGRYDNLMHRFQKPQGAIGFALYLDELERSLDSNQPVSEEGNSVNDYLNVALPKGRLGNKVYGLFEQAGLSCKGLLEESRKLVFEDSENMVRYFLVKPSDVDIYVEHGAADIGVVGKDVLLESGADVLELMDLGLGKCRLAVAGLVGFEEDPALELRVATKYPSVARQYYASQSRSVEIIKLNGSIELAPILGLSDVIVDIVETGSTLKENNLHVMTDVAYSSARLIANRASWRFKGEVISQLAERLGEMV